MKIVRRFLGVFVMIAGILGILLSLAGLVSLWVMKPTLFGYLDSTIQTLDNSVNTSQKVMEITGQALGATVDSVDTLSAMLYTTAGSVEDTIPLLDEINVMMSETVPAAFTSASESLKTAQQAAVVLDSAIKSLENFQVLLSSAPVLGAFVEQPQKFYNPDTPLADSLGELADNLEGLPVTFTEMSADLDIADDNLVTIKDNLTTMSASVGLISQSLSEYETMVEQSQSSMESLSSMLSSVHDNLPRIMNGIAAVLSLFFLWLLAAQVVIFSQGREMYRGIADRIE
jgi:methyl-accepting chemotaxis protein